MKNLYRLMVLIAIVSGIQCGKHSPIIGGDDDTSEQGVVQLDIRLSKAVAQRIDRVIAKAEHPLLGTVTEELTIRGTKATGSLEVPAGTGWVVTVEAYVGNVLCRRGSSDPVDVSAGEVVPVVITPVRLDSDSDGFFNEEDLFPYGNAKIQIVLNYLAVFGEDGSLEGASDHEIYFEIRVDRPPDSEEIDLRAPTWSTHWVLEKETGYFLEWSGIVDVEDDEQYHTINIQMWDYDSWSDNDLYDIDGSNDTEGLTLNYDLKTQSFTGDDDDGIVDGRDDGISEEVDGYLIYEIRTVVE